MANTGQWSGRLDGFHERLLEVERIVTERYKPPSRFGSAFRWYLENIETLKQIVAKHHQSATSE
jgi:hypothetical protein